MPKDSLEGNSVNPEPTFPNHEISDANDAKETRVIEVSLGARIRQIRQARGMSIAALSERSGLSKAMLSKIENAQTSCSLTSVARLADALDVSVSSLFQEANTARPVSFTKAGNGVLINGRGTRHNHIYELLGSFRGQGTASGPHLEPIMVTLNDRSDTYPRFQHPGTELLYMLSGEMVYRYQDADYRMQPGDALLIDGEGIHGPVDLIEVPIKFLAITAYPESQD